MVVSLYVIPQAYEECKNSWSAESFTILDSAASKFHIKIKESLHINWEKPALNQQLQYVNLFYARAFYVYLYIYSCHTFFSK